jgi:hypothetical protein
MANDAAGARVLLRRPFTATLQERASRTRMRIAIIALTPRTVEFVSARSLPPGTLCTLTIRATPPLDIDLAITATATATRDLFSCTAAIVRVRDRDRAHFDALIERRRTAQSA